MTWNMNAIYPMIQDTPLNQNPIQSNNFHNHLYTYPSFKRLFSSSTPTNTSLSNHKNNHKEKGDAKDDPNNEQKTAGDYFLDHLGTIFLCIIGIIIASLIRSSKSTSEKNKLRQDIEEFVSALDPYEINDLRNSNVWLDRSAMEYLIQTFSNTSEKFNSIPAVDGKLSYEEFVAYTLRAMKEYSKETTSSTTLSTVTATPTPSIQLGHLLDRVVLSILNQKESKNKQQHQNDIFNKNTSSLSSSSTPNDQQLPIQLLLVILSLAMNSSILDRVDVLFQIMSLNQSQYNNFLNDVTQSSQNSSDQALLVKEIQIMSMIDYLQQTSQLVPDAQIVESDVKYPYQKYKIASPLELVHYGKLSKKEELKPDVWDKVSNVDMANKENDHKYQESVWTCDDFHHLLRSRSVCAWGECYVKKRNLG